MDNNNHLNTNSELFKCPECGLHYKDRAQAEKCEAWCKEHHSCNLEIISYAVENNKYTRGETNTHIPNGRQ